MTQLQSSVDPAFSMFLEERRKEEKARADRARILRATSRKKKATSAGYMDPAKTAAIDARRREMNVNQTSGTAAQRSAMADRRAPEHHVVTDANGNQISVLGPRPDLIQELPDPVQASPPPKSISGPPDPGRSPSPLHLQRHLVGENPSDMGPPTAEDQVNEIMRMMEGDSRGVPNPNPNMMFSNIPSERDNLFTPEFVLNQDDADGLRYLLSLSPFTADLYPDILNDFVGHQLGMASSLSKGIGDGLNFITGDVLDFLDPTPQVQVGDLPETKELRANIAADRTETDEIVKAMPYAVDQFYEENGYVPSAEDLLAYVMRRR